MGMSAFIVTQTTNAAINELKIPLGSILYDSAELDPCARGLNVNDDTPTKPILQKLTTSFPS